MICAVLEVITHRGKMGLENEDWSSVSPAFQIVVVHVGYTQVGKVLPKGSACRLCSGYFATDSTGIVGQHRILYLQSQHGPG